MALSTSEISAIRFWLGYGNLTYLARPYFEIARVFEDVVQANMDSWGESYTRSTILPQLLDCDNDIAAARKIAGGNKVGDAERNTRHLQELLEHKEYWTRQLEMITKVPRAQPLQRGTTVEQG